MIFILLAVSLLLRILALNQSIWLDEAVSISVASHYFFLDIPRLFSISDFHPPLYYMFLNLWAKVFGTEIFTLRLSSVLFSLITIFFTYLIGKKIKDKKIGLLAALLLSINPLFVYFSQDLRMYSMAVMFLTIVLYNFIKIIKDKKIKIGNIIGFNLFAFLSFSCFYGSIFLLAALAIYLLVKRKFKLFFITNIGIVLAIGLLSPLLFTQIKNSRSMLAQVVNWHLVLGLPNLKDVLLIPLKFSVGKISFFPKNLYYLVAGLWTLIVFIFTFKGFLKNKIFGFLFIVPIILGFGFSFFSPLMQYFRFIYLLPILSLALAFAVNKNWQKIFLILGFGVWTFVYLLNPAFHREDWKSLANNLDNTKALYIIESVSDPIKYYRPDVIIKDLKTRKPNENEIKVVSYAEAIHGFDHVASLKSFGYTKIGEENYREVTLETWKN
ncbi:MAG: glycosyltransferase family 39 protein [Candidatus Shapirobacteria bacterium]